MATSSISLNTISYYHSYDNGTQYDSGAAALDFGYDAYRGHKYVMAFSTTLPTYEGNEATITLNIPIKRAEDYLGPAHLQAGKVYQVGISTSVTTALKTGTPGTYATAATAWVELTTDQAKTTSYITYTVELELTSSLSGQTIYIFFAPNSSVNSCCSPNKTGITGTITYTTAEAISNTSLRFGWQGSVNSTTGPTSTTLSLKPSSKEIVWGVVGLQNAANTYTDFRLFNCQGSQILNTTTGSTFVQGDKLSEIANTYKIDSNTTSLTGSIFYDNLSVSFPSTYFKIGKTNYLSAIAATYYAPGGYDKAWMVDPTTNNAASGSRIISMTLNNWVTKAFSFPGQATGSTTGKVTVTWRNGKNKNGYITSFRAGSSSTSTSGSNTDKSTYGSTTANSNATTATITLSGLTPGSANKVYLSAKVNTNYFNSSYNYYGMQTPSSYNYVEVYTDESSYSASMSLYSRSTSSLTLTMGAVDSTWNLETDDNGNVAYYVSSSTTSPASSISLYSSVTDNRTSGSDSGRLTISGLSSGTSYPVSVYVKSAETGKYYRISNNTYSTSSPTVSVSVSASASVSSTTNASYGSSNGSATIYVSGISYSGTTLTSTMYASTSSSSPSGHTTGTWSGSSGYITLTGLSAGTYTRYILLTNGSSYYYVDSVSFTIGSNSSGDASQYSGVLSASPSGITQSSIVFTLSSLSPSTNISRIYISSTSYSSQTDKKSSITSLGYAAPGSAITVTGRSAGTTATYYAYGYSSVTGYYYPLSSLSVTTDGTYSASLSTSNIKDDSASISYSSLSSTVNLNGVWYLSTTNTASTGSLTAVATGYLNSPIQLTGLSPQTSYSYYAYVKTGSTYYRISSSAVSFTTAADMTTYEADVKITGATTTSMTMNYSVVLPYVANSTWYIGSNYIQQTTSVSSLGTYKSANAKTAITMTGLTANTNYTWYAYIYYNSNYYYVGQVTGSTPASSYVITPNANVKDKIVSFTLEMSPQMEIDYWKITMNNQTNSSSISSPIVFQGLTPNTTYNYSIEVKHKYGGVIKTSTGSLKTLPTLYKIKFANDTQTYKVYNSSLII